LSASRAAYPGHCFPWPVNTDYLTSPDCSEEVVFIASLCSYTPNTITDTRTCSQRPDDYYRLHHGTQENGPYNLPPQAALWSIVFASPGDYAFSCLCFSIGSEIIKRRSPVSTSATTTKPRGVGYSSLRSRRPPFKAGGYAANEAMFA
jgi:hypothetical protein